MIVVKTFWSIFPYSQFFYYFFFWKQLLFITVNSTRRLSMKSIWNVQFEGLKPGSHLYNSTSSKFQTKSDDETQESTSKSTKCRWIVVERKYDTDLLGATIRIDFFNCAFCCKFNPNVDGTRALQIMSLHKYSTIFKLMMLLLFNTKHLLQQFI